ncbi:hypothetical protein NDU88_004514 [Pleurodeles waltl]|uniref:Uncharacterized protein n=1 Tax=Pleurodeles waltl TaxID=8319 RepID=A0AAV7SIZ6_PLEWA|nr:hypothetical protein NDU88_004514 [Pleurodeles waltl]
MHIFKNLEVEARKISRRKKVPDWSKDGGDKFYSLSEDSEAASSGCNQSATGGSQSTKALKGDYLGTRLTGSGKVPTPDSLPNVDGSADCQVPIISATSTDSKMLQIIYDSIKELQTETRAESRRARIATKRLQGAVHKVAKSSTEIEEKRNIMEDRTTPVGTDVEALKEHLESYGGQLTDIMWKLEDQENRQWRNNLHFLGI